MTFQLFREALEVADGTLASSSAFSTAFRSYMGARYYNWPGHLAADQKHASLFSEQLRKAEWEFDAFKHDRDPTKAPSSHATTLGILEADLVRTHSLLSLLLDGTQAYKMLKSKPAIGDKAWEHIFHGEVSGAGSNKGHVGLHSTVKIEAGQHNSGKRRNQITITVSERDAATEVYKAAVTIHEQAKSSTFFPDNWTEPEIKAYVTEAVKYWLISGSGANQEKNSSGGLVTWAGKCMVTLPNGSKQPLWIGGLGDATSATGIKTAYPQFRGSFAI